MRYVYDQTYIELPVETPNPPQWTQYELEESALGQGTINLHHPLSRSEDVIPDHRLP